VCSSDLPIVENIKGNITIQYFFNQYGVEQITNDKEIQLAKEKPDVVARINAALRAAHEYLRTHPAEAALAVPKYAPIDPALAPKIAVYDYWDLQTIDREAVQQLADLYTDKAILAKRVSTAGLYAELPK
jgi:ABC-type nitrate/sulfonate/bicarbonate transport system substrate-binding protein